MASMFQDRERAAEGIFVHEEELRFLVKRKAIQSLALWAAEGMGLGPDATAAYTARKIDTFVAGTPEDRLVDAMQTDLERAGKPALSTQIGTVFARAEADAVATLRGQAGASAPRAPHAPGGSAKADWGWSL